MLTVREIGDTLQLAQSKGLIRSFSIESPGDSLGSRIRVEEDEYSGNRNMFRAEASDYCSRLNERMEAQT
jgi:hypothetical protein